MKQFENLGCHVEQVDRVFAADPVDIWSAEFYAGAGTRLRPFLENKRELLDPAVADILDQALRQELRDYYGKVFERYALRDALNPFFERYDVLLSPMLPVTSLDVGKNVPDHLSDRNLVSWVYYTYPFNRDRPAGRDGLRGDRRRRHAGRIADRRPRARRVRRGAGRRRLRAQPSRRDTTCARSRRLDQFEQSSPLFEGVTLTHCALRWACFRGTIRSDSHC